MVVYYGIEIPSFEDADEESNPIAKLHFSNGTWDWYVIGAKSLENGDLMFLGLVNGIEKELGFFTLKQIQEVGALLDENFQEIGVYDIYEDFDLRLRR